MSTTKQNKPYFLNCPDFSERRFGIEIEFLTHTKIEGRQRQLYQGTVVSTLNSNGVACAYEDYNHEVRTHWKLTTDSSCGWELVSPPLSGIEGLEEVAKVCDILERKLNIEVDQSCGLHVHVEADELTYEDIKNVVLRYALHEKTIDSFMPKSRRDYNNYYCLSIRHALNNNEFKKAKTIQNLSRYMGNERYSKINLQSYVRYGTVEFRQHSGSVNDEKICNWIKFCVEFVDATRALTTMASENNTLEYKTRNTNPSKRLIKLANHLASYSNCYMNLDVAARRSGYMVSSLQSALKKLEIDYNWETNLVTDYDNRRKIKVYHVGIMPDQETESEKRIRLMKRAQSRVENGTFSKFKDSDNLFFNIEDSVSNFLKERSESFKNSSSKRRQQREEEQRRRLEQQEQRRTNYGNLSTTYTVPTTPTQVNYSWSSSDTALIASTMTDYIASAVERETRQNDQQIRTIRNSIDHIRAILNRQS